LNALLFREVISEHGIKGGVMEGKTTYSTFKPD
jgi:hypothetical protein